jgi:hypothetical protein
MGHGLRIVRPGSLAVRIAIASAVTGSHALADELPLPDLTIDALSVRESPSLFHDPGEPLLNLDIVPRPNIVGLGVTADTHRTAIQLGPRAKITMTGTSWKGYWDAVPIDGNEEAMAHGTRMGVGFHYDLGWLQIDAEWWQNTLSSQYGSGAYRDVSLRISKSHRFSRWVTMWFGLTIGYRKWEGEPPPGEQRSSSYIMLGIGGTFR